MPQPFSDFTSSSIYEGEILDPLPFLFPDESHLYTSDASGSQTASVTDIDFLRPQQLPLIPDCLTRVGPDKHKRYVLYSNSEMERDTFVDWWLKIDYGMKKRINWDTRHQSDCWKQFEQVADTKTGKPAVMCKHCGAILEHPASCRHGTSSMNKHLKGVLCRKSMAKKPNIKQLMENAVGSNNTSIFSFKGLH